MREEKLQAGKFDVDAGLVKRLIKAQFPQWVGLPIRPVADDGWDNWTFRLGDRLKVRLPSDAGSAAQPEKEARWLPRLARHLPVTVPEVVAMGHPGEGFPWPWSIQTWLEGEPVSRQGINDPVQFGWDVATVLNALQAIDTTGGPPPGPHNYFRGGDVMRVYGEEARRSVDSFAETIDAKAAYEVLDAAADAPVSAEPVWLHGDIAVGNLLVRDGALSAVIDFGGCAIGDPACDLVITWLFLEGAAREAFRLAVVADDAMWARARGWALWKAALVLANGSVTHPAEASPKAVIQAILAEHRAIG